LALEEIGERLRDHLPSKLQLNQAGDWSAGACLPAPCIIVRNTKSFAALLPSSAHLITYIPKAMLNARQANTAVHNANMDQVINDAVLKNHLSCSQGLAHHPSRSAQPWSFSRACGL